MVKKIVVKPIATDKEFAAKEGTWFEEDAVDQVIREDADVYALEDGNERLLAKFRKGVLSKEEVQLGWDGFRLLAIPSRNRAAAAGPIDLKGKYWSKRKPTEVTKWSARYVQNGKVSKMRVNNVVASGVLGYYESTAFLDAACRMTGYTRKALKNFLHGVPFLEAIDAQFKKLVPDAHAKQLAALRKHKAYQISNTAFSTLTVNLNFRTALHKDAGDFKEGFGNLSVIEWGKYHGGITMFPRFRVGFDVRTGDFLAMDVHEWHTNSKLYETEEDKKYNESLPDIRTRDPETGVVGSDHRFQRLTFVCYFREKLANCDEAKTREYYKREGFDVDEEVRKARRASIATLPIPGKTGTIEEAEEAIEHTPAGAAIKLAKTRKAQGAKGSRSERRSKTEKASKQGGGFLEGFF
jgi:hypothetical protein